MGERERESSRPDQTEAAVSWGHGPAGAAGAGRECKSCLQLDPNLAEEARPVPTIMLPFQGFFNRAEAEPAREQMHEIGSTVTPGLPELPRPAAGVAITMSRMGGVNQAWTKVASRLTNEDGRASAFLTWEQFTPGTYKMHFATGQYFRGQEIESFYPYAEVVFEIKDPSKHYHIPLLLNPFGYSTYRGS